MLDLCSHRSCTEVCNDNALIHVEPVTDQTLSFSFTILDSNPNHIQTRPSSV